MTLRFIRCFQRTVAFSTLLTFLAANTLSAAPGVSFATTSEVLPVSLADRIQIPESLGTIQTRFVPDSNRGAATVVHIQDAHASLEAQEHIRQLLHYLKQHYQLDFVLAEGGIGKLRGENLRVFAEESWNQELAERLLKHGVLSGSERFLLDEAEKIHRDSRFPQSQAYGLEAAALYEKNLKAYRRVLRHKKESENFTRSLKTSLLTAASNIFQPKLQKFFKEWVIDQDRGEEILRQLGTLRKYAASELQLDFDKPAAQVEWPHLVRIYKLSALERQVDSKAAAKELEDLKKWPGSEAVIATKQSPDFRSLLENFYKAAHPSGFTFQKYPALSKLWGQKILREEINALALFDETSRLTDQILDKLAVSEKEKALIRKYKDALLLSKLFRLELTEAEYAQVLARREALRPGDPQLDALYKKSLEFYRDAKARDRVMFEKMVEQMKAAQKFNAMVITGGFHSEGLQACLKEKGVAFVEIQPRITDLSQTSDYEKAMLLQGLPASNVTPNAPKVSNIAFALSLTDELGGKLSSYEYARGILAADQRSVAAAHGAGGNGLNAISDGGIAGIGQSQIRSKPNPQKLGFRIMLPQTSSPPFLFGKVNQPSNKSITTIKRLINRLPPVAEKIPAPTTTALDKSMKVLPNKALRALLKSFTMAGILSLSLISNEEIKSLFSYLVNIFFIKYHNTTVSQFARSETRQNFPQAKKLLSSVNKLRILESLSVYGFFLFYTASWLALGAVLFSKGSWSTVAGLMLASVPWVKAFEVLEEYQEAKIESQLKRGRVLKIGERFSRDAARRAARNLFQKGLVTAIAVPVFPRPSLEDPSDWRVFDRRSIKFSLTGILREAALQADSSPATFEMILKPSEKKLFIYPHSLSIRSEARAEARSTGTPSDEELERQLKDGQFREFADHFETDNQDYILNVLRALKRMAVLTLNPDAEAFITRQIPASSLNEVIRILENASIFNHFFPGSAEANQVYDSLLATLKEIRRKKKLELRAAAPPIDRNPEETLWGLLFPNDFSRFKEFREDLLSESPERRIRMIELLGTHHDAHMYTHGFRDENMFHHFIDLEFLNAIFWFIWSRPGRKVARKLANVLGQLVATASLMPEYYSSNPLNPSQIRRFKTALLSGDKREKRLALEFFSAFPMPNVVESKEGIDRLKDIYEGRTDETKRIYREEAFDLLRSNPRAVTQYYPNFFSQYQSQYQHEISDASQPAGRVLLEDIVSDSMPEENIELIKIGTHYNAVALVLNMAANMKGDSSSDPLLSLMISKMLGGGPGEREKMINLYALAHYIWLVKQLTDRALTLDQALGDMNRLIKLVPKQKRRRSEARAETDVFQKMSRTIAYDVNFKRVFLHGEVLISGVPDDLGKAFLEDLKVKGRLGDQDQILSFSELVRKARVHQLRVENGGGFFVYGYLPSKEGEFTTEEALTALKILRSGIYLQPRIVVISQEEHVLDQFTKEQRSETAFPLYNFGRFVHYTGDALEEYSSGRQISRSEARKKAERDALLSLLKQFQAVYTAYRSKVKSKKPLPVDRRNAATEVLRFAADFVKIISRLKTQLREHRLVGENLELAQHKLYWITHAPEIIERLKKKLPDWEALSHDPQVRRLTVLARKIEKKIDSLDLKLAAGDIVPGTQFKLGVFNDEAAIKSLRRWPEYKEHVRQMKPGVLSEAGFLGKGEDFVEVLLRDRATLVNLGTTPQQLADWLEKVIKRGRATVNGQKIVIKGYDTMGSQGAPLPGKIPPSSETLTLINKTTGFQMSGRATEMHPALIRLWGFFEGNTRFVEWDFNDPKAAAIFEEGTGVELSPAVATSYRLDPVELYALFTGWDLKELRKSAGQNARSEARSLEEAEKQVAAAESLLEEKKFAEAAAAFRQAQEHLQPILQGNVANLKRIAGFMLTAIGAQLGTLEASEKAMPAAIAAGFGLALLEDPNQDTFLTNALLQMGIRGILAQAQVLEKALRFAQILEGRVTGSNLAEDQDLKIIEMLGLRSAAPQALYQGKTIHEWRTVLQTPAGTAAAIVPAAAPPVVEANTATHAPPPAVAAAPSPESPVAEAYVRTFPSEGEGQPFEEAVPLTTARVSEMGKVLVLAVPAADEIYDARFANHRGGQPVPREVFQQMWDRYAALAQSREKITADKLTPTNAPPRRNRFREGLRRIRIPLKADSEQTFDETIFVRMVRYATKPGEENTAVLPPSEEGDKQLAEDLFKAYALTRGIRPRPSLQTQFENNIRIYRELAAWDDRSQAAQIRLSKLQQAWGFKHRNQAGITRIRFRRALGALGLSEQDFIQRLWRAKQETPAPAAAGAPSVPAPAAADAASPAAPSLALTPDQRWEHLAGEVARRHLARQPDLSSQNYSVKIGGTTIDLREWAKKFSAWAESRHRQIGGQSLNETQFLNMLLIFRDFHALAPTRDLPYRYLYRVLSSALGFNRQGKEITQLLSDALYQVKYLKRIDFVADLITSKPAFTDIPDFNIQPSIINDYSGQEIVARANELWAQRHGAQGAAFAPVDPVEQKLFVIASQMHLWLGRQQSPAALELKSQFDLTQKTLFVIFAYYRLAYLRSKIGNMPRGNVIGGALEIAQPAKTALASYGQFIKLKTLLSSGLQELYKPSGADPFSYLVSYETGETEMPSYVQQTNAPRLLVAQLPDQNVENSNSYYNGADRIRYFLIAYVRYLREHGIPPSLETVQSIQQINGTWNQERLQSANDFLVQHYFQPLFLLETEAPPLVEQIVRGIGELSAQGSTSWNLEGLSRTRAFASGFKEAEIRKELLGGQPLWNQIMQWLRLRYPDRNTLGVFAALQASVLTPRVQEGTSPSPETPVPSAVSSGGLPVPGETALRALDDKALSPLAADLRTQYIYKLRETNLPPTRDYLETHFPSPEALSEAERDLNSVLQKQGFRPVVILEKGFPKRVGRIAKLLLMAARGQYPSHQTSLDNVLKKYTNGENTESDILESLGAENDPFWNQLLAWSESLDKVGIEFRSLVKALREEAADRMQPQPPPSPPVPAPPAAPPSAASPAPVTAVTPATPTALRVSPPPQNGDIFTPLQEKPTSDDFFTYFRVRINGQRTLGIFLHAFSSFSERIGMPGVKIIERETRGATLHRRKLHGATKYLFDPNIILHNGEVLRLVAARSEARAIDRKLDETARKTGVLKEGDTTPEISTVPESQKIGAAYSDKVAAQIHAPRTAATAWPHILNENVKAVYRNVAEKTLPIVWTKAEVQAALAVLERDQKGDVTAGSLAALRRIIQQTMGNYADVLEVKADNMPVHLVLPVDASTPAEQLLPLAMVLAEKGDTIQLLLQGATAQKADEYEAYLRQKFSSLGLGDQAAQISAAAAGSEHDLVRLSRRYAGNQFLSGERGIAAGDAHYLEAVGQLKEAHRLLVPSELKEETAIALLAVAYLRDAGKATLGVMNLKFWMQEKGIHSKELLVRVQAAMQELQRLAAAA